MSLSNVLILAGHDPTGGAGIIADAEAVRAMGGWPLTIPTALTRQTTVDVQAVMPCLASEMLATAQALMEDCEPAAIKVGLIADSEMLDAVIWLCERYRHLPVVIDPVLKAGGGRELSAKALESAFVKRLLPLATLVTPNLLELERLAGHVNKGTMATVDAQAGLLLGAGAHAVLATGTDVAGAQASDDIIHRLYEGDQCRQWSWPRLAGTYHGSGCTLASAIAALLACGQSVEQACTEAQQFTWQSLLSAHRPGRGQYVPDRRAVNIRPENRTLSS